MLGVIGGGLGFLLMMARGKGTLFGVVSFVSDMRRSHAPILRRESKYLKSYFALNQKLVNRGYCGDEVLVMPHPCSRRLITYWWDKWQCCYVQKMRRLFLYLAVQSLTDRNWCILCQWSFWSPSVDNSYGVSITLLNGPHG